MLPLADVAAGPIFLVSVLFGLVVFLLLVVIEAVIFRVVGWASLWGSLRDALAANAASTLVGLVLGWLATPRQEYVGYDPERGGRLYDPVPALLPWPVALVLAFGLSVLIEWWLLRLLRPAQRDQALRAALVANIATYALIVALGVWSVVTG